jgi:hypothetical protein
VKATEIAHLLFSGSADSFTIPANQKNPILGMFSQEVFEQRLTNGWFARMSDGLHVISHWEVHKKITLTFLV